MKVHRSPTGISSIYDPQSLPSQPHITRDSQDLDDLIFALKTGRGYAPSEVSAPRGRELELADGEVEMRRISIADTHL